MWRRRRFLAHRISVLCERRSAMKENMLYGVHIGEHGFEPASVIEELKARVVDHGYNFVTIRTRARKGEILPHEAYVEWARYLAENKSH